MKTRTLEMKPTMIVKTQTCWIWKSVRKRKSRLVHKGLPVVNDLSAYLKTDFDNM